MVRLTHILSVFLRKLQPDPHRLPTPHCRRMHLMMQRSPPAKLQCDAPASLGIVLQSTGSCIHCVLQWAELFLKSTDSCMIEIHEKLT